MSPGLRIAVLLCAVVLPALVSASGWNYKDPTTWPGLCQTGTQQSPIDLSPSISTVQQLEKITFTYETQVKVSLANNGHTVDLHLDKPTLCSLSGGGLPWVYYLAGIHFHWGSEHTIQGKRLPLEMHLVHYSKQYSSVAEAIKYKNGLAVVGVLFKESNEANPKLEPLLSAMNAVNGDESKTVQMTMSPADLLPGDVNSFYRYQGSLTTPGCNESVVWTVMMATVPASKQQLTRFVTMKAEEGPIGDNYRPVQKLNGRPVIASRPPGSTGYRITPLTIFLVPVFFVFV